MPGGIKAPKPNSKSLADQIASYYNALQSGNAGAPAQPIEPVQAQPLPETMQGAMEHAQRKSRADFVRKFKQGAGWK